MTITVIIFIICINDNSYILLRFSSMINEIQNGMLQDFIRYVLKNFSGSISIILKKNGVITHYIKRIISNINLLVIVKCYVSYYFFNFFRMIKKGRKLRETAQQILLMAICLFLSQFINDVLYRIGDRTKSRQFTIKRII